MSEVFSDNENPIKGLTRNQEIVEAKTKDDVGIYNLVDDNDDEAADFLSKRGSHNQLKVNEVGPMKLFQDASIDELDEFKNGGSEGQKDSSKHADGMRRTNSQSKTNLLKQKKKLDQSLPLDTSANIGDTIQA